MSKAILELDMPNNCRECQLTFTDKDGMHCTGNHDVFVDDNFESKTRSIWCPLKEAPHMLISVSLDPKSGLDSVSYITGWNDCVKEFDKKNDEIYCTDAEGKE